jgi:glycosyltransferase involved in cell wall biosynthesis
MTVLMVINTTGFQYDDRLRKEVASLQALGIDVNIVGLEYANVAADRPVYDNVPATAIRLASRDWFPRGRGLVVKMLEMHARLAAKILASRADVIWCHDLEMGALVPVLALLRATGRIRRIVWDQHELPADHLLRSRAYKAVYEWLINRCDCVVMASRERLTLMREWLGPSVRPAIEVLHNYPDARFAALPEQQLPPAVTRWLGGHPYLLAQGGANPDRHLGPLVAAVLRSERLRLVVAGPYSPNIPTDLARVHGPVAAERVFFTGLVPQLELSRFIDQAYASVVLYQADSANTRLCAPNRLYQALARGVPVVVGANPPMANLVGSTQCGVVLRTDGNDVDDLCEGLRALEAGHDAFKRMAAVQRGLTWDSQTATVARTVESTRPLGEHNHNHNEDRLSAASLQRR